MRRIQYQLYEKNPDYDPGSEWDHANRRSYVYVTYDNGLFHSFGVEGADGETNCVAIIELPDGSVITALAEKCKFLTPPTREEDES